MVTIERIEEFEDRLGISLDNISVKAEEEGWFYVYCEVTANNGGALDSTLNVQCIAYAKNGSILSMESTYVIQDRFYGFEVLEFAFQEDGLFPQVDRLKVFPKKA